MSTMKMLAAERDVHGKIQLAYRMADGFAGDLQADGRPRL